MLKQAYYLSISTLYFIIVLTTIFSYTAPLSADSFITSTTCTDNNVLGCRAFDSMGDMLELNDTGVANSPNMPLTNGNCRWNGGSTDCFPAFDEGTCATLDALGPRSQNSYEEAKRWSPCYDQTHNGARLTFWNDLGSSVQQLNAVELDQNIGHTQLWTQYEIMLSPEFFFSPEGTTSSKLYRIRRVKSDECKDDRFADHRFLEIYPDRVSIGPVVYCAGASYAASEGHVTLDTTRAMHWIRITTHYDIENSGVYFWAYDVTTDQLLAETFTNTHGGENFFFTNSEMYLSGLSYVHHSSSHDPNPAKPSPNYWLRNTVVSTSEITPYPGGEQPPEPETCTAFTYSPWEACQANNTQTRSIVTSTPLNCTGGDPVLTQACDYTASPPLPPTSFTVQ